jgi:hypothetical protein
MGQVIAFPVRSAPSASPADGTAGDVVRLAAQAMHEPVHPLISPALYDATLALCHCRECSMSRHPAFARTSASG